MTALDQDRDGLQQEAIRVLTRAAHESTSSVDGLDFADFLAHALASAAANVGGADRLLARRPGSWEASHLDALLRGTVGDEPDSWWTYRTEPLIVPLNVAELIEISDLHPGLLGLDDAIDAIGQHYESATCDDAALDAWDAEIDTLITRYKAEYQAYAERFTRVAAASGQAMCPPIDVRVTADASPTSRWWDPTTITNPNEYESDDLAVAIWDEAHDAIALPNVEIVRARVVDRLPAPETR
ncbi:hypothetical protein MLP_18580 [Microlunatus phosphovorus NM-1]|uniref:Uncharacterized protein n=1 Tax=Microlunatus phosphovorus (strain ATCC 700054 / DSM 10555 / JCM 9379 / NBRC 101784 / NCIMB 13414 / VKM Ac-1990 / NM-1) TaxID=1032480 RepID=F5XSJ1_MICPN|nr:hypothetical protein [Microlunatus phosphovorus]BAK34872.1 hypothetical protein MLP_18580 [Microlunatus phosphovorus NM-1]